VQIRRIFFSDVCYLLLGEKTFKLHTVLKSAPKNKSPHTSPMSTLSIFNPVTEKEVSKIILNFSNSFCDLDLLPMSLLKQTECLNCTLTNHNVHHQDINLSHDTGVFPDKFKLSSVILLLKNHCLDKEDLSNYRPISHLSFLSKLTERVVKNRLTQQLLATIFSSSFQSAYTEYNSTKSTLLAVHDHIVKAMSQHTWHLEVLLWISTLLFLISFHSIR